MDTIQVNGQRIWGPPSDWSGPLPPHGTEVYVKNVPEDVMESDLYRVFATVGEVYEVRVPVHWNGLNRGYAFVRYTETQYANRAIKELNKQKIRVGWQLKVERSIDNNRLFLSGVPNHKTGEEILNDLSTVVDNVKKVYVYPSMDTPALYRGYAFVEFVSHRDAAIAKRILTPDVCFNLFERKCVAAWANPLPFLHDSVLEKINILFMRNIPPDVKTLSIKKMAEMFVQENCVENVKRLNDIAFITFKTHELAKKALDVIKGRKLFFGNSQIEVEWAVPKQFAQSNRSTHRSAQETNDNFQLDDKDKTKGVKEVKEVTWKNRVKTVSCLSNIFRNDSNLKEWQKKFIHSSKAASRELMGMADEMGRRNLSLSDFINNNIISFNNESENEFPGNFETPRLTHLRLWLEKFMGTCPPVHETSQKSFC